jgi:hypothetical protein
LHDLAACWLTSLRPSPSPTLHQSSQITICRVASERKLPWPVVVGGGTPFLPPVTEDVRLDLIETRTFGSRVIYERYRRVRDDLG